MHEYIMHKSNNNAKSRNLFLALDKENLIPADYRSDVNTRRKRRRAGHENSTSIIVHKDATNNREKIT